MSQAGYLKEIEKVNKSKEELNTINGLLRTNVQTKDDELQRERAATKIQQRKTSDLQCVVDNYKNKERDNNTTTKETLVIQ